MRHDYEIQMCSVESREDTPFLTDQDYTLEAEDAFKRICYSCDPVILHGDVWMITMPYSHMPLSFDDLFS